MFFPNAASVQNAVTGQGQDTTLEEDGITLFIALGNELEGIIEGPATYASFKAELSVSAEIGRTARICCSSCMIEHSVSGACPSIATYFTLDPVLPDQPFRDTEPSASLDGSELLLPRSFLLPD